MDYVFEDIWASIVVVCNELIADFRIMYPGETIQFIDWETHGSLMELPDCDLIGPTGLTVTEASPGIMEAVVSIAFSSYANDANLFRQRRYAAAIFDRMRALKQIEVFDLQTGTSRGAMYFVEGTMVAPMSKAESRPWQYVQGRTLLEPLISD